MKTREVSFDPFRDGELFISVPTTESQKEIWGSIEIDPDANLCYNESIRIYLEGNLDKQALEKAINEVLCRHDALRGTFSARGKDFLVSKHVDQKLNIIDITQENKSSQSSIIANHIDQATKFRFDLHRGPLIKFDLVAKSNASCLLFITAHHLICDGWSIAVIVNEISSFYESIIRGETISLKMPKQLYDYAVEAQRIPVDPYWTREFSSLPKPMELPLDFKRPAFRRYESKRIDYKLDQVIIQNAQKNAAKNRKSYYQYLLTAFDVLLYKLSKNDDFVVGISSATQSGAGLNDLVGHLVNLLPIRVNINEEMSFSELLSQTKTKMLDAFDHQSTTFGQILKSLDIPRDPARIPLVNIIFNVDQQYEGQGLEFKDIKASYESNPRHYENFEIFINATTLKDHCVLECQYNIHLYSEETITKWLKEIEGILDFFNKNIDQRISSYQMEPTLTQLQRVDEVEQAQVKSSKSIVDQKNLDLMRDLWEKTLGVNAIPLNSNFFSIGGHSLLGVDICHQVFEGYGVKLTLKDLILNPSLEAFASLLPSTKQVLRTESLKGKAEQIVESSLTKSQFQTWYLEQVNPGTSMHNLPTAVLIKGSVDLEKLENAYCKFVDIHSALRTVFDKGPIQRIVSIEEFRSSFSIKSKDSTKDQALVEMNAMAAKNYDLCKTPLFDVKLYKLPDGNSIIFSQFHHIVWDGWCFDIFFKQIDQLYRGEEVSKEEVSYLDFAKWQEEYLETPQYKEDLSFWKKKLSGELPVLEIPTDFPRPPQIDNRADTFSFSIDQELALKLRRFCEEKGFSLFSVFLSCFKKSLMDFSNSDEVIVGIPVRGRNSKELMNTIGYFVNALPIRSKDIDSCQDFMGQVQNEVADALSYQDVPFSNIIQSLDLAQDSSRNAVFQSFFSFQDVDNREMLFNEEKVSQIVIKNLWAYTDIDLWMKSNRDSIIGGFEFRKDLFSKKTIQRLFNYFHDLLTFLTETQTLSFSQFNSRSVMRELSRINNTFTDKLPTKTIHEYIEEFAKSTPESIASICGDDKITYRELDKRSSSIAAYLQNKGVQKGDLVGLSSRRDSNMLACLIGIMKAGAGYVPLDPYFPADRLDYMIEHSRLKYLLTNREFSSKFSHHSITNIEIESIDQTNTHYNEVKVDLEQTIYVIYTSGSTGLPKGVNLSYRSVLNFLESMKVRPGINSANTLLAVTTLSFDIAVLELYLPLICGATLVIATKEETIDGDALRKNIETNKVDIMQATPSTWRLLLAADWKGKSDFKVLCGGEPFPKDLAATLLPVSLEVWNMYGPTETTVWSTCKQITDLNGPVLIGSPISNTSVYILDEKKKILPIGAIGELFIGGDGLALGYIHAENLTKDRFVTDTIRGEGQMYQTGDLARFNSNGELECLGRNDGQVKVRGFRIELGEIETTLHEHENVNQAVVMVREDRPGDVRIVAYLRSNNEKSFDQFELRAFLGRKLPQYMIPSNYILVDEFPQTLNGKIDKKSLPSLNVQETNKKQKVESYAKDKVLSKDELEDRFAKVWLGTLGVDSYNKEDNFFEVGGYSLLSVDLFSKVAKEFNVELSLSVLINHNTFSSLLDLIRNELEGNRKKQADTTGFSIPSLCKSLVPINTHGTKGYVFCFHGVGGNVLNYMKLSPAMAGYSLIGVQSQGVDEHSLPLKTIPQMAQKYVDEIRLVQPKGPYILAGASMGGTIAVEVANVLQALGEEIKSIILLDTFGPNLNLKKYSSGANRFEEILSSIKWRLKKMSVRLRSSFLIAFGRPIPHNIRYFNIEVFNYQALWNHKIKDYTGDIDIIRAPITSEGWYSDPLMGWDGIVKGEIRTHVINGDHSNFVEAPELPKAFENVLNHI